MDASCANAVSAVSVSASTSSNRSKRHFGCFFRAGFGMEITLLREAATEHRGHEHRREAVSLGIEPTRRFVEAHSLDGNAILSALELRHQIAEGVGGFELGIALDD